MCRAVLVCVVACAAPRAPQDDKPAAPVTVTLDDRDLGGGDHEITLTAVPAIAVDGMTLRLAGADTHVGPTAAGVARTVTARVHESGGTDVVGGANLNGRSRAAVIHIGATRPAAIVPSRVIRLSDGTVVREVRP